MLKETADRTTVGDHGHGVIELINELVENDLAVADRSVARHRIALGTQENGGDITFHPARQNLLLAGTSGSGKSTLATGLLERLGERGYQLCVIDPEGTTRIFHRRLSSELHRMVPVTPKFSRHWPIRTTMWS